MTKKKVKATISETITYEIEVDAEWDVKDEGVFAEIERLKNGFNLPCCLLGGADKIPDGNGGIMTYIAKRQKTEKREVAKCTHPIEKGRKSRTK